MRKTKIRTLVRTYQRFNTKTTVTTSMMIITHNDKISGSSQITKFTRHIRVIQIERSLQIDEPHWLQSHDKFSLCRCIDPRRPTIEISLPIQAKNELSRPFWLSSKSRSSFSSRNSKRERTLPSNSCASPSMGKCSRLSVVNKVKSCSEPTR